MPTPRVASNCLCVFGKMLVLYYLSPISTRRHHRHQVAHQLTSNSLEREFQPDLTADAEYIYKSKTVFPVAHSSDIAFGWFMLMLSLYAALGVRLNYIETGILHTFWTWLQLQFLIVVNSICVWLINVKQNMLLTLSSINKYEFVSRNLSNHIIHMT